jgi:hypothetical protein
MAELKAKPLPAELNHALRGGMPGIPTAIAEPSQREPERGGEGADLKKKRRRAPATVQLNVAITEALADMIAEEAVKAGSTTGAAADPALRRGPPVASATTAAIGIEAAFRFQDRFHRQA